MGLGVGGEERPWKRVERSMESGTKGQREVCSRRQRSEMLGLRKS